jgi:hypothetical protein
MPGQLVGECGMHDTEAKHRTFNGVFIYIVWNLWKERNRRIFENEHKTAD